MDKKKVGRSIYGFIVADAMGVPYEFKERDSFNCTKLRKSTPEDFHGDLPLGTWSDDSSLLLCVLKALSTISPTIFNDTTDPDKLTTITSSIYQSWRENSIAWMANGKFTANEKRPFDIGVSCQIGIRAMKENKTNEFATSIRANGNGGLMRIPPITFYTQDINKIRGLIRVFNECSHYHNISNIGCLIYIVFAQQLLCLTEKKGLFEKNNNKTDKNEKYDRDEISFLSVTSHETISDIESINTGSHITTTTSIKANSNKTTPKEPKSKMAKKIKEALKRTTEILKDDEIDEYKDLFNLSLLQKDRKDIKSSGYVVNTLYVAIWCLYHSNDYNSAVQEAINMGNDTDTQGALCGFLAGLVYRVPHSLIRKMQNRKLIDQLIKDFISEKK